MLTSEFLATISQFSPLAPLVTGLPLFRRLDRPLRILVGMFVLAACTEAAAHYLAHGASNLWLVHLWTPIEFTLTILAFACWQQSDRVRRILHWAIPAFLLLVVMNKIFLESFNNFDNYSRPIGSMVLAAVAVFTFQRMIVEPGDSLIRDPRFWVSSAVLIYHAGTLTLFTLGRMMLSENMEAFRDIYMVHSVINILTCLLFAGGFLCRPRR